MTYRQDLGVGNPFLPCLVQGLHSHHRVLKNNSCLQANSSTWARYASLAPDETILSSQQPLLLKAIFYSYCIVHSEVRYYTKVVHDRHDGTRKGNCQYAVDRVVIGHVRSSSLFVLILLFFLPCWSFWTHKSCWSNPLFRRRCSHSCMWNIQKFEMFKESDSLGIPMLQRWIQSLNWQAGLPLGRTYH